MANNHYQFAKGFPRTRGDRPFLAISLLGGLVVPPHTRG